MSIFLPSLDPHSSCNGLFTSGVFFGGGFVCLLVYVYFPAFPRPSVQPQWSLYLSGFFCFFWFMSISLPSLDPQSSHNGLFISLFFCFVFLNNFVCGCFGVLCPFFLVQQQWSLPFSGFFGMFFCFLIIIIIILFFYVHFPAVPRPSVQLQWSLPLWVFGGLF